MAITSAQLQTALGDGNMNVPRVLMQLGGEGGAKQYWLIDGNVQYPGRTKLVTTTASDSAATQATAVRAAMLAGPA